MTDEGIFTAVLGVVVGIAFGFALDSSGIGIAVALFFKLAFPFSF